MLYSLFKSKQKTLDFFKRKFKKNEYLFNDKLIIKMFKNHFKQERKLTSASLSLNTLAVIRNNQC